MSNYVDLGALWRVATFSLLFAVGFVGFYSLAVRALAAPDGGQVSALRRGAGYACYAVCAGVIIFGVRVMLAK